MFSTAKRIASQKGKKRVSFAEGVKEEPKGSLSFLKRFEKPKYSTVKKTWLYYSAYEKYEELQAYLSKCVRQGISLDDFFLAEGQLILSSAMRKTDTEALEFIYENVPQYLLYTLFAKNTYIIEGFLMGHAGLDERHLTNEKLYLSRMKKFALLLKLGTKELIEKVMTEYGSSFPDSLKEDYAWAVKDYESSLIDASQTKFLTPG